MYGSLEQELLLRFFLYVSAFMVITQIPNFNRVPILLDVKYGTRQGQKYIQNGVHMYRCVRVRGYGIKYIQ